MSQNAAQIRKQLANLEQEERALQRFHVQLTGLMRNVELESMRLNALKSTLLSSQRATESNSAASGPAAWYIMYRTMTILKSWRFLCATQKNYAKQGSASDLKITENCIKRFKEVATKNEHLRVMVDGGGCSGFEYKISFDEKIKDDDVIFCKDEVKVLVDEKSLDFLKGATVDYSEDLMRSSFRILDNPVAEKGCSCGSSFTIKMD